MLESQKFTHDEVGYENPSTHAGERCGGCKHFIPATGTQPAACEGVQRPIQISAWCHRFKSASEAAMEKNMAKKHHKFSHTHIEHHDDGSATMHHVHESDPKKDVKHAVGNLDEMHDSMQDHLGAPNPGEAEADAGQSGVPGMAGAAPAPVAGAAGPGA